MQQYFVCTLLSSHFCTRKYRQRSTILHAKNETLTDPSCWIKIKCEEPTWTIACYNFFSPLIQEQPICNSDWFYYTWNRFHQSYNLFWLFCVQYQWKRMYQISVLSNRSPIPSMINEPLWASALFRTIYLFVGNLVQSTHPWMVLQIQLVDSKLTHLNIFHKNFWAKIKQWVLS
jgi:hypothetical protein